MTILAALAAAYERWDGRGWPGELEGEPCRSRRVSRNWRSSSRWHTAPAGSRPRRAIARQRSGTQFDPELAARLCADADEIFGGARHGADLGCGDRRRAGARRRAVGGALRGRAAGDREVRRPQVALHARAFARGRRAGRGGRGAAGARRGRDRTVRRAGLVHDFGRLGVSNAIWDKPGPLGAGEWERVRMHPYVTERMLHQSEALAPLGRIAVQHRERLDGSGYPRGLRAARSRGRRGSSAPPTPTRRCASRGPIARRLAPTRRPPNCAPTCARAVSTPRPSRRSERRRPSRPSPPEGPAGLTAREIEVLAAARPRSVEQGDRRPARDLAEDSRQPHRAHLHEDRCLQPRRRRPVRDAARAAPRGARSTAEPVRA